MSETVVTQEQLVENVKAAASALADTLDEALEGGVGQAQLLPELVTVFKTRGLLP